MDTNSLLLAAWLYGVAAFAYSFLFVYLDGFRARTWTTDSARSALQAFVLLSVLWAGSVVVYALTGRSLWLGASHIINVLRYGAALFFMIGLLRPAAREAERRALIVFTLVLLLSGAVLWVLTIIDFRLFGDPLRLSLYCTLGTILFAMLLLEQLFRNVQPDSLWSIKPFILAFFGAFAFDFYLFSEAVLFSKMDVDIFSVRGMIHALIIPLLATANVRAKNWASKIRISQRAAFHSTTLLFAGAYLVFISLVAYYVRYFGGEWGRALQLAVMFLALLLLCILALSGSIRSKVRVFLAKNFFHYRYDYREEWLRFTRTLSEQTSSQALGLGVIRGLADMVESPGGTLWLRETGQSRLIQAARWNLPECNHQEAGESSLVHFLESSGWVVNLDEYRRFPQRYESLSLPDWVLETPGAWLIVPLVISDHMKGFVILASPRTPLDINWEVIDLLKTAGCQAASFIAQRQATDALIEAKQFDSFNRMSAFVVHDLKNIVTQLALMLRNAEKHRHNPEFQEDMLMTVDNAVEKMRQLMLQLREGAAPAGAACGVNLSGVIERIGALKAKQGRLVNVKVSEPVLTRGQEDRLARVIDHLVQNALDATPQTGNVAIHLTCEAGLARVDVIDNGQGMSQEFVQEKLFRPFQTTKTTGMGIGAYESFQYVKELGGRIQVESEISKGTHLTLYLPLYDFV